MVFAGCSRKIPLSSCLSLVAIISEKSPTWYLSCRRKWEGSCWESLLGLAQQVFLPAVLHPCHPMLCSGIISYSWAEPRSWKIRTHKFNIDIFALFYKQRIWLLVYLFGSFLVWLQCFLLTNTCVMMTTFLWCTSPSFFPLSSLSSFQFFCSGCVWLQPSFALMIRLNHATAPHISSIYCKS